MAAIGGVKTTAHAKTTVITTHRRCDLANTTSTSSAATEQDVSFTECVLWTDAATSR